MLLFVLRPTGGTFRQTVQVDTSDDPARGRLLRYSPRLFLLRALSTLLSPPSTLKPTLLPTGNFYLQLAWPNQDKFRSSRDPTRAGTKSYREELFAQQTFQASDVAEEKRVKILIKGIASGL